MQPFVVDLSHHNVVADFAAVKATGITGIIHKASQGISVKDDAYAPRRKLATDAGLLWGAYHFATGLDVAAQVESFLLRAQPDANTLMVLDYEDYKSSNMSIDQCADFLDLLGHRLGRKPAIYGGNRIREQLPKASPAMQSFIASHRLWLCQYGPVAHVPSPWKQYFLWQFTGDGIGPMPHSIAGITTKGIDLSTYAGTPAQLEAQWSVP